MAGANRETWCPDCDRAVGVMTPPVTPRMRLGPRKRVKHGNPRLPRVGGRMPECAGSRMEVPDVAIYEVAHGPGERRKLNKARLTEQAS